MSLVHGACTQIEMKLTPFQLTPASSNFTATTGVRVGLSSGPAVIVRCAAAGAGYTVPLHRAVADVTGCC